MNECSQRYSVLVIEAFSKYRKPKPLEEELPVILAGGGFEVLLSTPSNTAVAIQMKMAIAAGRPCQAVIVERLPGEPLLCPEGEMAVALSSALLRLQLELPVCAVLVDPDQNQIMSIEPGTCELKVMVSDISDVDLPTLLLSYLKSEEESHTVWSATA